MYTNSRLIKQTQVSDKINELEKEFIIYILRNMNHDMDNTNFFETTTEDVCNYLKVTKKEFSKMNIKLKGHHFYTNKRHSVGYNPAKVVNGVGSRFISYAATSTIKLRVNEINFKRFLEGKQPFGYKTILKKKK